MPRKELTSEQRAIIIYARQQGESLQAIANYLGCGKTTVGDALRRLEATGTTSPRKRSGRPKTFGAQELASLKKLVTTNKNRRLSASQIRDLWEKKTETQACTNTIRHALTEAGLHSCIARQKPLLTETHMANRLQWAIEHRDWPVHQWRRVLWSDESMFHQFQQNSLCRVWREPEEEFHVSCLSATVKHSPSRMFWGCFSYQGLGPLVSLRGPVTGEAHAKTLKRYAFPTLRKFFPRGNGIFQEDNARPHTSKVATTVKEESGLTFLSWPAQSPDLNPIENLWNRVKKTVYSRQNKPKNLNDLERAVKAAWKAIPLEEVQAVVDSMPRRIEACVAAKGGPTKY
jgi:transposase